MTTDSTLSIIIVSWNTVDLLARCLASLWQDVSSSGYTGTEVFVVDNGSSDGSATMVRDEFPWVNLLEMPENTGFALANNRAIAQSHGRLVLLLNPDTEVKLGALKTLIEYIEAHSFVGAVGARLLNSDGSLQTSCYPAPTLSRELWRLAHLDALWPYGSYRMQEWILDQPRAVDVLLGACILLRREVLDQVGALDEKYFMYSEEVDLCYRIRRAGWQLHWVPQATVVHHGGRSTQQVASAMFVQLYRSKLRYFRKNHGRLSAWAYKLILLAASVMRLAISPLALLEGEPKRQKHFGIANQYLRLAVMLPRL